MASARGRRAICAYLRPCSPISLTLLVADCRSVGSLVVQTRTSAFDVPAAAGDCTSVNGARAAWRRAADQLPCTAAQRVEPSPLSSQLLYRHLGWGVSAQQGA